MFLISAQCLHIWCIIADCSGKGGPNNELHEVTMEFYGEIDPSKSKYVVQSRNIPMVLMRKEAGAYWPHLLSTKEKVCSLHPLPLLKVLNSSFLIFFVPVDLCTYTKSSAYFLVFMDYITL